MCPVEVALMLGRVKLVLTVLAVWVASSFVFGGLWVSLNWRRTPLRCVEPDARQQPDMKAARAGESSSRPLPVDAKRGADQSRTLALRS